ncbi:MAG TPA: polyprenyl diphosphate synthase [Candidatus Polarisedimenticolaceae bacterium]|nr:polyprenyl diphosphate synthase [Candidatus Polarisedimenticolaceae bacterium]
MTGLHVAVIMDGNGRWAAARGRPRLHGHRAGAEAVRRTVETAVSRGVSVLTLYAFSSDNWKRPSREVRALFALLERWLRNESARCREEGVRLAVIGRRDRLHPALVQAIAGAERATAEGRRLLLRLAVDYSSRDVLVRAAERLRGAPGTVESFARAVAEAEHGPAVPPVDLLIRTGGERRLSDFLLWESAYAELVFVETPWPEFDAAAFDAALAEFARRQRRFGAVPRAAAS